MSMEHVIKEDYMTDELDSGEDDDSSYGMPSVIRFNEEYALSKDFTFKVGMDFSSLKQFKNVILEHNVLNGRNARFQKSDANRSRMETISRSTFIVQFQGYNQYLKDVTYVLMGQRRL
ncbi:hypothetical protein KIW84_071860 [Lathyrus oleraceus]|uniref:Uncharacterized protein n=1 Tax=Pisum sativum TaxID=3888 RepID=A0A9D4VLD1_PEA|nr:hypothetical protein KIW84_071860 [Pisum sativum]